MSTTFQIRGYLLHITHYDPQWIKNKATETPFNLNVGLDVINAVADAGLNLLVIDVKDGLRYASHPELARHYTQPMETLHALCERARKNNLEIVIKLNFSQSALHQHNHWFRPHNDLFDNEEYFRRGFQIIDELVAVAKPARFFHIGMDEDHSRSYRQYVAAIQTLRDGLLARNLRTLIWNDTACLWPAAEIHHHKSLEAMKHAPLDVIHIVWDYYQKNLEYATATFQRVKDAGLELWIAPTIDVDKPAFSVLLEAGRQAAARGVIFTNWIPCIEANREGLLARIRKLKQKASQFT